MYNVHTQFEKKKCMKFGNECDTNDDPIFFFLNFFFSKNNKGKTNPLNGCYGNCKTSALISFIRCSQ